MTITSVFGLKKPDAPDAVKRSDFNFNWDILDAHTHDLAKMTGIAPVANGGTGGNDALTARANIGADDASNLSKGTLNIARLPVAPVTKGGTGADNAAGARANLGAASTDVATALANGLMSAADKSKLDGVAPSANNYTHPNSGVSTGTYRKVTVNNQGHVTAANNDLVSVAEGGTGAGGAEGARSNLGVPPILHTDAVGTYGKASAAAFGHAMAGSALPASPGIASAGTDNGKFAREDHIHPAQSSVTGNAGTATKLETARKINGALFDGSADISFGTLEPVEIPTSADMNNYTTPGLYFCPSNATAATLANCPTTNAFYLFVGKHAGTYQQFVEYMTATPKVYFRNMYNDIWGGIIRQFTTVDAPTSVSGNAGTATKLRYARSISLSGGATASGVSFDGSRNIGLNVTALDMGKANAGTLSIARGGTGATSASGARSALGITRENLGAAASSHTHSASNITSGTLSVSRGGTGQTSTSGIRNALGLGNTTGALPVSNGGTGTNAADNALTNLGMRRGFSPTGSVKASGYTNINVSFSSAFPSGVTPYIQITLSGTQTNATSLGKVSWAISARSNTGFTIRVHNASNSTFSLAFMYLAVLPE